jgi:hypothetical protein
VTGASFLPRDVAVAVLAALAAQASFVLLFALPTSHVRIQPDETAPTMKSIAVKLGVLPLLKRGSSAPAKSHSDATKSAVKALTSKPNAVPVTAAPRPRAPAPASTTLGAANGSADGTEVDPLKARAADTYRGQLASWFASRFAIRGKVPFETLKTLHATATIQTGDRRVTGFSMIESSGNAVFDDEVRALLSGIQSSGLDLPAPPPAYPDMLSSSVTVSFRCTVQASCE